MNLQQSLISFHRTQIRAVDESPLAKIDPRALLITTLVYLLLLLSLPLETPGRLVWLATFPIIMAPLCGLSYVSILCKSCVILPFVLLIGIFNPLFDSRIAFSFNGIEISYGWLTFFSIVLRGLLSMQVLLILIKSVGFLEICNSMKRLGAPNLLTTQLLLLYRFTALLMEEALKMKRAVASRGYGKKNFSIKMWTTFIGTLLFRSIDRSKKIHNSMLARGFDGSFPTSDHVEKWNINSSIFCFTWGLVFMIFYNFDFSGLFNLTS